VSAPLAPGWLSGLRDGARTGWRWLRRISGDDAFEQYLSHHARTHPHAPVLSRREFYEAELARKWSGINRCC
jgi:uncharacterized short protein YbdD (DUF466 family)